MMDKRLTVNYADAAEKFVKSVVVYSDESCVYYDEAHEVALSGEVLFDLFFKTQIIVKQLNSFYTLHRVSDIDFEMNEITINFGTDNNQSINIPYRFVNEEEAE